MGELRIQNMQVGQTYVSSGRMVSRTDVELFCTTTGMMSPLFLSDKYVQTDEASKKVGLRGSVIPGQLSYAIMLGNLVRDQILEDVIVQLGANGIKWPAPAYPYDTLRTEIVITGNRTTKGGDAVIVDYDWEVKNQNDTVVIQGSNTCMFKAGTAGSKGKIG